MMIYDKLELDFDCLYLVWWLGICLILVELDEVQVEMFVIVEFFNVNGVLYGGVIMVFVDMLGGIGMMVNFGKGEVMIIIESKMNFLCLV